MPTDPHADPHAARALEVSLGNFGVYKAVKNTIPVVGDDAMDVFLELVPERGWRLYALFQEFQRQQGGKQTEFVDFVRATLAKNLIRILYPRGCALTDRERAALVGFVQRTVGECGVTTGKEMLSIFLAEGKVYEAVRQAVCRGCHRSKCRHNLKSRP